MGKRSRIKGHSFERLVSKIFRESGFPEAKRQLEYQIDQCQGIDIAGTHPYYIQCKRYKDYAPISKIEEVKAPKGGVPLLITKADNKPAMVVIPLENFLELL